MSMGSKCLWCNVTPQLICPNTASLTDTSRLGQFVRFFSLVDQSCHDERSCSGSRGPVPGVTTPPTRSVFFYGGLSEDSGETFQTEICSTCGKLASLVSDESEFLTEHICSSLSIICVLCLVSVFKVKIKTNTNKYSCYWKRKKKHYSTERIVK